MRQKKRAAAVLLSAVMAFSAVSPAVPVWAASWQKNASGSYIGSDGSVLTGILSRGIDVSQWQQNINWSAVADDDIQFAMIGTRYNNAVDPYLIRMCVGQRRRDSASVFTFIPTRRLQRWRNPTLILS